MRLLEKDVKRLESNYPDAARFLRAAELREEHFTLLCRRSNRGELNAWERDRLGELNNVPAVQEPDHLRFLERAGMPLTIEETPGLHYDCYNQALSG